MDGQCEVVGLVMLVEWSRTADYKFIGETAQGPRRGQHRSPRAFMALSHRWAFSLFPSLISCRDTVNPAGFGWARLLVRSSQP